MCSDSLAGYSFVIFLSLSLIGARMQGSHYCSIEVCQQHGRSWSQCPLVRHLHHFTARSCTVACMRATKLTAVLAKEFTRLAITANIAILDSQLYDNCLP